MCVHTPPVMAGGKGCGPVGGQVTIGGLSLRAIGPSAIALTGADCTVRHPGLKLKIPA